MRAASACTCTKRTPVPIAPACTPDGAHQAAHAALATEVARVNGAAAQTILRGVSAADDAQLASLGVPAHIRHAVVLPVRRATQEGDGRRRKNALVVSADSQKPPPAPVQLTSRLGNVTVYGKEPDGTTHLLLVAEFQDAAAAARLGLAPHELRDELERCEGASLLRAGGPTLPPC